jgi:RNA polymerase sigma-70 factor (ECF subfamily)
MRPRPAIIIHGPSIHAQRSPGSEAVTSIRLSPMFLAVSFRDEDTAPAAPTAAEKARLAALVGEHFEPIWRTMTRLRVPSADLADCVQQVFVVASRRLSAIAIGSERSFLIGTAIHVARDARRALGRRREVPEDEGVEPLSLDPAPDELADQKRLRALLDEVLAAMPDDLREVFVLFELEEMSTPEIATLLEIPTGTAASRLRRAREEFDRRVARLNAASTRGARR